MTAPRPEPLEGLAEALAELDGPVVGSPERLADPAHHARLQQARMEKARQRALAALDHLEKAAEAEASLGHAARYPDNPVLAEQAARWLRAFKGESHG